MQTSDGVIHYIPSSTTLERMRQSIDDYEREHPQPQPGPAGRAYLSDDHFGDDVKGWNQIQIGAVLALIVPLFVLVVGSALGWAIRGFRT